MSRVRQLWRGLVVLALTCWALFALGWSRQGSDPAQDRELLERHVRRFWRRLLRALGVEVTLMGSASFAGEGPQLIVSNHQSALDIAILGSLLGGPVLSRADIAGWPILGTAAKAGRTIFVDRDDRQSGARAIRAMRAVFRQGGSMAVFPEGATYRGDEVKPFRPGAFVAVRGLGAEVIPAGFVYEPGSEYVGISFGEHVARLAARRRTRVVLSFGSPMGAHSTAAKLAEESAKAVRRLVAEARAEADSLGMERFEVASIAAKAFE